MRTSLCVPPASRAIRIGNAVGAAFTNRRVLEPVETRLLARGGAVLRIVAVLFALFPRVLVYPMCLMGVWLGVALLCRSVILHHVETRDKG
jgi:cardiolipin synthase A/B